MRNFDNGRPLGGDRKTGSEASEKHRIPAIDRTMDVLSLLERRATGATISDMVEALNLPRTTIYRIVNSLQSYEVVRRGAGGVYTLGPRLLALAARILPDDKTYDLAALSKPHLEVLSEMTGECSKVSIVDSEGLLVIAAVPGSGPFALSSSVGQRMPIHAGAAGKVLLAHMTKSELEGPLKRHLAVYTQRTLRDPQSLQAELAKIRRQGWAFDSGEYAPSIHAYAAPIPDRSGKAIAALSVPFLAGADKARRDFIRASVINIAGAIAGDLHS